MGEKADLDLKVSSADPELPEDFGPCSVIPFPRQVSLRPHYETSVSMTEDSKFLVVEKIERYLVSTRLSTEEISQILSKLGAC